MKFHFKMFMSFFVIGLFTIGGGMAMLPLVQNTVVNKRKWMTEDEMVDCIAVCQSIPGPVIINISTYIGRKVKGITGSIAAVLGAALPSFICIILAVTVLDLLGDMEQLESFFKGALSAASAMILIACVKMGKNVIKKVWDYLIAIGAFVAVVFFHVSIVWIIIVGIAIGIPLHYLRMKKVDSSGRGVGGRNE